MDRCTECKKRLSKKVVSPDGRAWHEECFTEKVKQKTLISGRSTMALTLAQKKKFFNEELLDIKNGGMKKFLIETLDKFPDYFFNDCPASSTGKYHPPRLNKPDGTYVHTRLVVRIVKELARISNLDINRTEALVVAAICHDMNKYGTERGEHTVFEHPELAVKVIRKIYWDNPDLISFQLFTLMTDSMKYHYGRWGYYKMSPIETGFLLGLLHIADAIASQFHTILKGLDIFKV